MSPLTMNHPRDFKPDWCVAPGETLREWCVETGLSPHAAATACMIEPDVFERLLSGDEPLTGVLAAGLASGTGITASFWLNFERHYREALAGGKVVIQQ